MIIIAQEQTLATMKTPGDLEMRGVAMYWEALVEQETYYIHSTLLPAHNSLANSLSEFENKVSEVSKLFTMAERKRELISFQRVQLLSQGRARQSQQLEESSTRLLQYESSLACLDQSTKELVCTLEHEESVLESQLQAFCPVQQELLPILAQAKPVPKRRVNGEPYYPLYVHMNSAVTVFDSHPYLEFTEKRPTAECYQKYHRLNLEGTSQSERQFFEKIMPLIEGEELYRRLAGQSAVSFDPLEAALRPPESCGYALRHLRLHKLLTRIDSQQKLKPGVDLNIATEQIVAPVIPQRTLVILQVQEKLHNEELQVEGTDEGFRDKCLNCTYYPFTVVLTQNNRVELIARSYLVLKQWINGLNALVHCKKQLRKLKGRIESYTTV